MRICIPTEDERGLQSRVFGHFGSTPFLTMIDVHAGDMRIVPNPECHSDTHNCQHVDLMRLHGVGAVVCTNLGRRAYKGLSAAGFDILDPGDRTVGEIVEAFKTGGLSKLPERSTCSGGGGDGGHCHSEDGHQHRGGGHSHQGHLHRHSGSGRRQGGENRPG